VRQLVDFFNMVAGYVATTIVMERSMKLRVKMLEKWVDIANHSFKIQVQTYSPSFPLSRASAVVCVCGGVCGCACAVCVCVR
jgi:hypothetical protein